MQNNNWKKLSTKHSRMLRMPQPNSRPQQMLRLRTKIRLSKMVTRCHKMENREPNRMATRCRRRQITAISRPNRPNRHSPKPNQHYHSRPNN